MGFDIMSLQRNRGPVQSKSKADEGRAVLKYIDVDNLVPSEDNFYSMSAIEELAALIELSGGVKQPALVVPLGGGKYKVIAGHRRRLASIQLVKQGKDAYRKMPCMVDTDERKPEEDADELRAIDEAILLITTNSQREKTDWDKVQEATHLRDLLNRKRQFEKIPGETRKIIAEQLGTTPAQVGRYDSIAKHLIAPFLEWMEQRKIGISVAYELSTLPKDVQQKAAAECWGKRGPVTLEDVRRWKEPVPVKPPTVAQKETPPVPKQGEKILLTAQKETGGMWPPEREKERGDEEKQEKWLRQSDANDAGKDVDFSTPLTPTPSADQEAMDKRQAAMLLEDLREYCEEMTVTEGEQAKTWIERADALVVAISALRRL